MNQFKIVMHQWRTNQRRYFNRGQFIVPFYQMIQQKLNITSILRRLITAAMCSIILNYQVEFVPKNVRHSLMCDRGHRL